MGYENPRVDRERASRHRAHARHERRWHGERLSRPGARPTESKAMTRLLAFLGACVLTGHALAQVASHANFPSKPLKIVVGYPPGGSGDFLTRMAGDELTKELGVPVGGENRPGAGGNIAHEFVARPANDGYTIPNAAAMGVNRAMYAGLTQHPVKRYRPVTPVWAAPRR